MAIKQKHKILTNPTLNTEQKKQKVLQIKKCVNSMVSEVLFLKIQKTYCRQHAVKDHVALILK